MRGGGSVLHLRELLLKLDWRFGARARRADAWVNLNVVDVSAQVQNPTLIDFHWDIAPLMTQYCLLRRQIPPMRLLLIRGPGCRADARGILLVDTLLGLIGLLGYCNRIEVESSLEHSQVGEGLSCIVVEVQLNLRLVNGHVGLMLLRNVCLSERL